MPEARAIRQQSDRDDLKQGQSHTREVRFGLPYDERGRARSVRGRPHETKGQGDSMAESVALALQANGADIQGENTQISLGRENTIECLYFEDNVRTARDRGTGMATGRRTYEPIIFRKRIDKSSPLLAKALCDNERIDGRFMFYRPAPEGDGTTQHFFTVVVGNGRIAFIKRVSPDTTDPASSLEAPFEEVGLVFDTITWTYEPDGVEHQDSWRENQ